MNTFYQMWGVHTPEEAQAKIAEQRAEALAALNGREPQNLEEQALCLVGKDIFYKLIKEYTEKQWGRPCTELPAFIIRRLPLRFVFDNNYFNDPYQGIPIGGYNLLIERLLDGIDTRLNCDFFANRDKLTALADTIIYVVNYTSHDVPYTRVIEHKHFESFGQSVYDNPKTIISREYSTEWQPGMEPYYPVNDERNAALYAQYKSLADTEKHVLFGGRLAEYKYYDMAPTIEQALMLADHIFDTQGKIVK